MQLGLRYQLLNFPPNEQDGAKKKEGSRDIMCSCTKRHQE